jgi:glutaredoxin-related protein
MTKIYVMESCPDCTQAKQLYGENPDYEIIDIGKQARSLKEFLVLRDNHPAFAKVRERGTIGIPCFVKEDGTVIISMKHYEATLSGDSSTNTTVPYPPTVPNKPIDKTSQESKHPSQEPTIEDFVQGAACNLDGTGC